MKSIGNDNKDRNKNVKGINILSIFRELVYNKKNAGDIFVY